MERRFKRHDPAQPVRQAHRRHRLSRTLPPIALVWAGLLAAVSMGTVLGGGQGQVPADEPFQPVMLAQAAVDALSATATTASAVPRGNSSLDDAAGVSAGEPGTLACADRVALTVAAPPPASSPPAARPPVDRPTTQPVAAFLGDSYTTGYSGFGLGSAGWPAIVSTALGLQPLNRAVAGTGFVNPGWTDQPIRTRVEAVVKANPRVIFLAGGHNDRRYGATAAMAAAVPVIDRLHAALPGSLLVIVGPIWQSGNVPAALRSLNDQLRQKAASIGASFIDPVRGGWFAGTWQQLISADGIHPTNAGHRRIADLVLAALAGSPALAPQPVPAVSPAPAPATTSLRAAAPCPA